MNDYAKRLNVLDVCVVSDALDALGVRGSVAGVLPVWEGSRLAGRVITMRTVPADGRTSTRHLGTAAIERAAAGEIIVVEQTGAGPDPVSGTWGGLLAQAARLSEVGGVVIDGACRDIDEIRELGLPVSARTAVPFTARGRYIEDTVGEPVVIGGVTVATGDYVIADASGLAFVEAGRIEEVLARAERLLAKEHRMAAELRRGSRPSDVLGRDYEELLHGD